MDGVDRARRVVRDRWVGALPVDAVGVGVGRRELFEGGVTAGEREWLHVQLKAHGRRERDVESGGQVELPLG